MADIIVKDEIASRNLELAREAVGEGRFGGPLLDLDTASYSAYREGKTDQIPKPWGGDPACEIMVRGVADEEVLCLAGGGGLQSAIFSLLGAKVTVLDLTPEQLDRDHVSARHYGYAVTTIQGDMRDLSGLANDRFARVFQPISTLYVADLREVYRGVARVLKPGGFYFSDYVYPLLKMPEKKDWDGEAYVLRFSQPHISGKILERESDGVQNFTEGVFFGEFNHLFSDIINGQVAAGLSIVGVWESPRHGRLPPLSGLPPGSHEHRSSILPYGLSVVSQLVA